MVIDFTALGMGNGNSVIDFTALGMGHGKTVTHIGKTGMDSSKMGIYFTVLLYAAENGKTGI